MTTEKNPYDLESRTAIFAERVIAFCRSLKRDSLSLPIATQLIRSGTSIGANYMEANGMNSKKEFIYKISLCKKEANETKYWLRMILPFSDNKEELNTLGEESHELVLIFQKIASSSSKPN